MELQILLMRELAAIFFLRPIAAAELDDIQRIERQPGQFRQAPGQRRLAGETDAIKTRPIAAAMPPPS